MKISRDLSLSLDLSLSPAGNTVRIDTVTVRISIRIRTYRTVTMARARPDCHASMHVDVYDQCTTTTTTGAVYSNPERILAFAPLQCHDIVSLVHDQY